MTEATKAAAGTPSEGRSQGGDETYCAFVTEDIEADHAAPSAAGVDVDDEIASKGGHRDGLISLDAAIGDPVLAQFFFRDPDGNRLLIVQPG